MTEKRIISILKAEQKKIAANRDRLRNLRDDVEAQLESCDRALENLDAAIDALSEYV